MWCGVVGGMLLRITISQHSIQVTHSFMGFVESALGSQEVNAINVDRGLVLARWCGFGGRNHAHGGVGGWRD